jgi:hypothetical protein
VFTFVSEFFKNTINVFTEKPSATIIIIEAIDKPFAAFGTVS